MRIDEDIKLDYSDVLLRPKRSTLTSRKDVDLEREFAFYHSPKIWKWVPIMTANMATSGTFSMARALAEYSMITTLHKYYTIDEYREFFQTFDHPDSIAYTLGIRDADLLQLREMEKSGLMAHFSFICLDVPNGYIQRFLEVIRQVRSEFPEHIIIAGNVVTNEMTEEIIIAGADIVKIGIGPGSVCTTRKMTWVGYPQLSAVIECADAAHGTTNPRNGNCGLIIADGGQQFPSCIAKAFCGGADWNMCGSLFSGYDESGGDLVEKDGIQYKEYYGSSSNKALLDNYGKKESHRASEGRYVLMPYKWGVSSFIQDLMGSLRSTGTYIWAHKLKHFSKCTTFLRVNRQLTTYLEKYEA
jgi:GMP reductase